MRRALTIGALAATVAVLGAERAVEAHPEWIARGLARSLGWETTAVSLAGVEVHGTRLVGHHLVFHPPQPGAPDVYIREIRCALPSPAAAWTRVVDLGDVELDGFEIRSRRQRPPDPVRPPDRDPVVLTARSLIVTDGQFTAPADDPLPPVSVAGVDASFVDVRWTPRLRSYEGQGTASAAWMRLGEIGLTEVVASLVSEGTWLSIVDLRLATEGGALAGGGVVRGLDGRPQVRLELLATAQPLGAAVQSATGSASPLRGVLSGSLLLESGGTLPRGGSRFTGALVVHDASMYVGDLDGVTRAALGVAPWFGPLRDGWLSVQTVQGEARFGRGYVDLWRLEQQSDHRQRVQAWGAVRADDLRVYVRAIRPERAEDHAGMGIVVDGVPTTVRLATREELLDAPPLFP